MKDMTKVLEKTSEHNASREALYAIKNKKNPVVLFHKMTDNACERNDLI